MKEFAKKMFINGEWVDSSNGKTFDCINPATNEIITALPDASKEDVDRAVQSARKAYNEVWSKIDPAERANYLFKIFNVCFKT